MHFFEHYKRSLTKAITFRILAIIVDFIIVSAITRRSDIAFGVVTIASLSNTILYFVHERFWNHVHWGKNKHKKSS